MKHTFLLLFISTFLFSCNNSAQNKNLTDAKEVAKAIKQIQPGGIPTTETGWMMKATINGKQWTASSIVQPDMAGRILGDADQISIGLPYNRSNMVAGSKTTFSHDDATDIFLPANEGGILGGYKGEMIITKVNEQWAEGTFYFSASSDRSNKTAEVTNGFFRISMATPQK
jgi:hypothetical protein